MRIISRAGIEGMEEAAQEKRCRFRGSVQCVGSWHTHPTSEPQPSDVDIDAVVQLLGESGSSRRTCLVLILSGDPDDPVLGAHAFRTKLVRDDLLHLEQNVAATVALGPPPHKPRNLGLALSGGGSRAIAFHLGCLRALHDLDLLGSVQVISSVSGGSVISAMYAYSNDSFGEFDARTVQLLGVGLHRAIFHEMVRPASIAKLLKVRVAANVSLLFRMAARSARAALRPGLASRRDFPPARTFSRTEAFRDVLVKSLFGDRIVRDVVRDSLHTVINATELRSGSAFRFGSKQSGCWRFGTISPENALVADAVAASAAYPVCLPALDRKYRFTKKGRISDLTRVLLTDGGVFENLGVSPMEPGRTPSISTNVFDPDYIICCDAGAGLFDDDSYPTRWPSRMYRSFLTVFRKVQDATRKRLHNLAATDEISGFAPFLLGTEGQCLAMDSGRTAQAGRSSELPNRFRCHVNGRHRSLGAPWRTSDKVPHRLLPSGTLIHGGDPTDCEPHHEHRALVAQYGQYLLASTTAVGRGYFRPAQHPFKHIGCRPVFVENEAPTSSGGRGRACGKAARAHWRVEGRTRRRPGGLPVGGVSRPREAGRLHPVRHLRVSFVAVSGAFTRRRGCMPYCTLDGFAIRGRRWTARAWMRA